MKKLYQLEYLVWMATQSKSPFLQMYRRWMFAELEKLGNLPVEEQIKL